MRIKTSKHKSDSIWPRHSERQMRGSHGKGCRGERRSLLLSAQLPSLGRYVNGMVHLFYQSDDIVRGDPELQAWCREITEVGLCHAQDRGKICPRDRDPASAPPQAPGTKLPSHTFPSVHESICQACEHPGASYMPRLCS